jgi:hypothetical protein
VDLAGVRRGNGGADRGLRHVLPSPGSKVIW